MSTEGVGYYVRTSTGRQDGEGQREAISRAVRAHHEGAELAGVEAYEDLGCTGKHYRREGLQRLMADATAGRVRTLYVYALDRLGRTAVELLQIARHLADAGVRVVFVQAGLHLDVTSAMGSLMLTMLAGFAEFERMLILERAAIALAARKARGHRLGPPRRDPPADTLRWACALRDSGESWRHIAALTEWPVTSIRRAVVRELRRRDGVPETPPPEASAGASK